MAIVRTYNISFQGPSINIESIGGSDDWENNAKYRYTYHKEATLWSDWMNLSLDDLNSKTFKSKHIDIEIEVTGESSEDFPVLSMSQDTGDAKCELPTITTNDNTTTTEDDDSSESCTASLRITDCDDADASTFNPYSTGSASQIYEELSSIVSDTFGIDSRYFRTSPVRSSADYIFHEFSLKNVAAADNIKILIEDNKLPSRSFTINNVLLDYQETLTVHITKSEFHNVFGKATYPREHDYLAFNFKNFNKMYEVIGVYNPDDFLYEASYWIVLLQPYQERSMVGTDSNDSEVIKDRDKATDINISSTLNIDDGDLTKEVETFTFNSKAEKHKQEAIQDTEKARGDSLLNDKILDNSRKRSDFIADQYDNAIKCESEIIYHLNIPIANYNYVMSRKGVGSCGALYHKYRNDSICRISFIFKPLATLSRNIPILSDGDISVWATRKTISIKKENYIKTATIQDAMTNKWHVVSIIMDEDDISMTRISIWKQSQDLAHSKYKFDKVIAETSSSIELYKPYPLLNDADYGEVCLFGGPYSITNIKIATNPLPIDREFSEAISQVSQDMQYMIVSDIAIPRVTCESIQPIVKHPDKHDVKPIPKYKLILYASPLEGGVVNGAGEYDKGTTVTITASLSTGYTFVKWSDDNENISRDVTIDKDIELTAIFEVEDSVHTEEGMLPGLFSISENQKVRFSQGNLMYNPSSKGWKFSDKQYEYIGEDNTNISPDYDGFIDLFGWGCTGIDNGAISFQPYSTSTNDNEYHINGNVEDDIDDSIDWGSNKIANNENVKWKTMSKDEWEYLYNCRENASSLRTRCKIDDINGYVFFPDSWTPEDVDSNINIIIDTANYGNNTYTSVIWNVIEKSGAVFLPASGDRNGIYVDEVNSYGDYWTTTHYDKSYSYCFTFNKGREFIYYANRSAGHNVRLVSLVS